MNQQTPAGPGPQAQQQHPQPGPDPEQTDQNDVPELTWLSSPQSSAGQVVEIAHLLDGGVAVRDSCEPGTVLRFTAAEWTAFCQGAQLGEFDLPETEKH